MNRENESNSAAMLKAKYSDEMKLQIPTHILESATRVIHILREFCCTRGNPYHTSIDVVAALVIAFQLNDKEANELFYAAFPQFRLWKAARDRHYTIEKTNDFLHDNGFPVLKA